MRLTKLTVEARAMPSEAAERPQPMPAAAEGSAALRTIEELFERYSVPQEVIAYVRKPHRMLIDGNWVGACEGQCIDVIEPSSGLKLAEIPRGEAGDVDKAVSSARKAHEDGRWRRMTAARREEVLLRLADLLQADAEFLAVLETLDNGKPITASRTLDTPDAVRFARYMAGWTTKLQGAAQTLSSPDRALGITLREPVGVVGAITPWNFPLNMAVQKVVPALAAGCTVVLKPAEQTSLTALRLGELALEAGVPPGTFNIVTGIGAEAGEALVRHPDVAKITFTGSTAVGTCIGQLAMLNMTRLTLELGGSRPWSFCP